MIKIGLACRPSLSAAARPSFTRQRRESSRWGRRNVSNRLENWPEGLLHKTSYKTSPGYFAINTEADAKTNRKTTNPLLEVCARAHALVRRGLTEGGLVGQVAVRGASPSEPPQLITTVCGWPETLVKICCDRRDCISFSSLSKAKIAK